MKLLADTWLLFRYNVKATLKDPTWTIIGIVQPLLYLVLFAPLLKSIAGAQGFPPGGALNVFTPGLLVLMALFGSAFVGFSLIADIRNGVIERLRVTPVSRLALLLGRALRDVAQLIIQSLILVVAALPFGLEINSIVGLATTLVLISLIGFTMVSCSYALALFLKNENALAPLVNSVTLPLLLLSGVLLPLSLAPGWLKTVADINPLSHAVEAARALMFGNLGDGAVVIGFAIMVPLTILALWWAARSFQRGVA